MRKAAKALSSCVHTRHEKTWLSRPDCSGLSSSIIEPQRWSNDITPLGDYWSETDVATLTPAVIKMAQSGDDHHFTSA